MSKTGYTKNKIIDIIASSKKTTLSHISEVLELHPSTVSQHLKELKAMGAIEEIENNYIKKWKFYKLNPNFEYDKLSPNTEGRQLPTATNKAVLYTIAIILVAVASIGYTVLTGSHVSVQKSKSIQIALTDPPTVPDGTQSLYINYSSFYVHLINSNGSAEWVQLNTSGTANLMSLINASEIIAGIKIPQSSRIDMLKLSISSAYIIINGSRYNLILRDGQISTDVLGSSNSSSEILVDLSPTVVPMYINGVPVFVMLPEAGSVSLNQPSMANSTGKPGSVSKLTVSELRELTYINSNVSIVGPSLAILNDSMNLSVTIRNNGNKSVVLRDIFVLGDQNLSDLNGTYLPKFSIPVSPNHMGLEFLVQQNGTLAFANSDLFGSSLERLNYTYPYATPGYELNPNQSLTLQFNGSLPISNSTSISLIKGISYKISVLGDYVSHLAENVTST